MLGSQYKGKDKGNFHKIHGRYYISVPKFFQKIQPVDIHLKALTSLLPKNPTSFQAFYYNKVECKQEPVNTSFQYCKA